MTVVFFFLFLILAPFRLELFHRILMMTSRYRLLCNARSFYNTLILRGDQLFKRINKATNEDYPIYDQNALLRNTLFLLCFCFLSFSCCRPRLDQKYRLDGCRE
ncbi:hypothetical protein Tcan_04919 [Toxocara canis]|uniref:Secreted protein n=1 Tax=Toxocara canis TaxID=6265 RepID=A0A0B2VRY6_TOXCA|nr:hypothetical protein Tcan_04919 [Toxocara canis]